MDVLAEVLEFLALRGSVYCRSSLGSPWQLQFEAHQAAVFHVVERGSADLNWLNGQSLRLETGDFVMLTRGEAHALSDPQGTVGARVPRITMRDTDPCRNEIWCEGEPSAVLLCGTFTLDTKTRQTLLSLLPDVVHIRSQAWLTTLTALMALEVARAAPGLESVIRRLSEVLFVQVVRHHLETNPHPKGWLGGLRDPRIGRVLEAIHSGPQRHWTVARLAEIAQQSRSAFAARFKNSVGRGPLEYLTHWRMALATNLLESAHLPLLEIAQRSGYDSEVAFHRAYKRITGRTPGAVRRTARRSSPRGLH